MSCKAVWTIRRADADAVGQLEQALALHPLVARILVARGMADSVEVRQYLEPRLSLLEAPTQMAGLEAASDRLTRALVDNELIGVFGDYDVDGISSSVLVADYVRRAGGRVTIRVARRDEGYGLGVPQVEEMLGRGCELLVVTDCGTSDHEAVRAAMDRGVDVVAVDHHRVTRDEWPGLALVNPQQPRCGFPFKGLASVGLAFYLVASVRRRLERAGLDAPDPREWLDLVALGTVADVAPMERENRILVSRGLARLGVTQRPGLQELMRIANLQSGRAPTSEEIGWRLGPRLNAPGRLGDASVSLDCLWQRDTGKGILSARRCDALNEQRKAIQTRVESEAQAMAQRQVEQGRSFLLVAGEGWHPGVIGIVASRIVGTHGRPAAAIALTEEPEARGSARSVPELDLVRLLRSCADEMVRFGGHAAAAGFSVRRERVETLGLKLHEAAAEQLRERREPALQVDADVGLEQVDQQLCHELSRLGPYGCNNPEPVLVAGEVNVVEARAVGENHLRLRVRQGKAVHDAIGFGMRAAMPRVGSAVDIAFIPEIEVFQGRRVRLRLVDICQAGDGLQSGSCGEGA